MKVLADTCVMLWLMALPERLPPGVRRLLEDGATECVVSVASLWECLIKHGQGRLGLVTSGKPALDFLLWNCERHALEVLPVGADMLRPLEHLPALHGDPFDRMLICQAIEQGLAIVTPDAAIRRYPVRTIWE